MTPPPPPHRDPPHGEWRERCSPGRTTAVLTLLWPLDTATEAAHAPGLETRWCCGPAASPTASRGPTDSAYLPPACDVGRRRGTSHKGVGVTVHADTSRGDRKGGRRAPSERHPSPPGGQRPRGGVARAECTSPGTFLPSGCRVPAGVRKGPNVKDGPAGGRCSPQPPRQGRVTGAPFAGLLVRCLNSCCLSGAGANSSKLTGFQPTWAQRVPPCPLPFRGATPRPCRHAGSTGFT